MKKFLAFSMAAGLALAGFAAENIYKGNSKKPEDRIFTYMSGRFYTDAARKKLAFNHNGSMVSKEAKITAKTCVYRFANGKAYKGFSLAKNDCIASILETRTKRGAALEAKIYEGFVVPRNVVSKWDKKTDTGVVKSFKLTSDGIKEFQPKILFTVANNKIYKGDSTDDKDCVLTYTGNFPASRLLFMAIEFTGK